jgi:hypothetical protein
LRGVSARQDLREARAEPMRQVNGLQRATSRARSVMGCGGGLLSSNVAISPRSTRETTSSIRACSPSSSARERPTCNRHDSKAPRSAGRLAQGRKVCHCGGERVGIDRFSDVSGVSGPDGSGSILLSRESGEVMALAESLGEQCAARFTPCRNECVCPGNRNDVDCAP